MKPRALFSLCVPIVTAAVLAGCQRGQDRTAIDRATDQSKTSQELTLTGCLGTGVGTNQFMLTAVQLAPLGSQPNDASSSTANAITPDSQVRLAYQDDDELARMVGQKVTLTGRLIDDGRNSIGTSGQNPGNTPANGKLEPRHDKSQAASSAHHSEKVAREAGPIGQQSMANGTFPEMRVTGVSASGEKCPAWPTTERR